jgi:hypothetical protein
MVNLQEKKQLGKTRTDRGKNNIIWVLGQQNVGMEMIYVTQYGDQQR